MSDAVQQWMDHAQYDLETARAMMTSKRYLYVVFCCQQAVEKVLKALFAEQRQELPPRIHDLRRLAEEIRLQTSPKQFDFLGELSGCYLESRYPNEMALLAKSTKRPGATRILRETEEMVKWLSSMRK